MAGLKGQDTEQIGQDMGAERTLKFISEELEGARAQSEARGKEERALGSNSDRLGLIWLGHLLHLSGPQFPFLQTGMLKGPPLVILSLN